MRKSFNNTLRLFIKAKNLDADVTSMKLKQSIELSMILLFICVSLFNPGALASSDEEQTKVAATFAITFDTATNLTISIEIDVEQITTDKTYTKQDIIDLSKLRDDQSLQELGALRYAVYQILREELKKILPDATLLNFAMPVYQNQRFTEVLNANLASEFFQLDPGLNAYEVINGALDMDAVVSYVFEFQATKGWNNTYTFILPDSLLFRNTTGTVDDNRIQWTINNWNGLAPTTRGYLSLQATQPTTPKASNEDIRIKFNLDTTQVHTTHLQTTAEVHSIDISSYNILPSTITNLNVVPADGIRLFISNNFLSWDEIKEKTMQTIKQEILSTLQNTAFSQTPDLHFDWDPETTLNCTTPYTITAMDARPPITAIWTDANFELTFFDLPSRAAFGLISAGAQADVTAKDLNFGTTLDALKYSYTGVLTLPPHLYLNGKNTYQWNNSTPFSGTMTAESAPIYTEEKQHSMITIEFSKMDISIPSLLTGKTELTAPVSAKEDIELKVIRMPIEFSLPETMYLEFMNSDTLRLCIEEQVFTPQQISTFLTNKKQLFEATITSVLRKQNIIGYIDQMRFNSSLQWDRDIGKMDANAPVIVSLYTHSLFAVPFNISFLMPSFSIYNQQFILAGLEDREVTYRIIFPAGISITSYDMLEKTIVKSETEKGQPYLEVTFSPQEARGGLVLTCSLTASSMYVVSLFLPCILSIVLTVILLIVLILFKRKRRMRGAPRGRRRKPRRERIPEEEQIPSEMPEQDYYVPPPPPSSRR